MIGRALTSVNDTNSDVDTRVKTSGHRNIALTDHSATSNSLVDIECDDRNYERSLSTKNNNMVIL